MMTLGALVELAQQMEEQGPAGGAERQVAKLVEDDEIGVGEPRRDLARFALKLFLFESVDEFDGGEEPDALAVMLDGLDADRRGEMRFARCGRDSDMAAPGFWRTKRRSTTPSSAGTQDPGVQRSLRCVRRRRNAKGGTDPTPDAVRQIKFRLLHLTPPRHTPTFMGPLRVKRVRRGDPGTIRAAGSDYNQVASFRHETSVARAWLTRAGHRLDFYPVRHPGQRRRRNPNPVCCGCCPSRDGTLLYKRRFQAQ